MKHIICKSTVFIFLLTVSSCKECITCSNVCYECTQHNGLICNTDLSSPDNLEVILQALTSSGSICSKVSPTESDELCNNKRGLQQVIEIYENQGYECK
jgi:hypothetical protein